MISGLHRFAFLVAFLSATVPLQGSPEAPRLHVRKGGKGVQLGCASSSTNRFYWLEVRDALDASNRWHWVTNAPGNGEEVTFSLPDTAPSRFFRLRETGPVISYFESFDKPGQPVGPPGTEWKYKNTIHPAQSGWDAFVPGDGYAHLVIAGEDDRNDKAYQYIKFTPVHPNQRLEICAKNLVIPRFTGFIFTYTWLGNGIFSEIDIEVVADDANTPPRNHDTLPPDGWNDARFNCWVRADENNGYQPEDTTFLPIYDLNGQKVSLCDEAFHTYTIDWINTGVTNEQGLLRFFIDGVLQHSITNFSPYDAADLLIGFRDFRWAKGPTWSGTKECLVDWLDIQPIDTNSPSSFADAWTVTGTPFVVASPGIVSNDLPRGHACAAVLVTPPQHGSLTLHPDGGFTYRPEAAFHGTDRFFYRLDSGEVGGSGNAACVFLTVP